MRASALDAGTQRYGAGVLIGNSFNERVLKADKQLQLLEAARKGQLKTQKFEERMALALAPVQLSRPADGLVHFGDTLQLVSLEGHLVLAIDTHEQEGQPEEQACRASAAPLGSAGPVVRTAVTLAAYAGLNPTAVADVPYEGTSLRYGQKVQLLAHPSAAAAQAGEDTPAPLALYSRPKTATCCSRFGKQQVVGFTAAVGSYDTAWEVAALDPGERVVAEGQALALGAPCLLVHCATGTPLALDGQHPVPSDFGAGEVEVCCRACVGASSVQGLEHASLGHVVGQPSAKPVRPTNWWAFLGDSSSAEGAC